MLDYVEICEELGAAYGVLPQAVLNLPWVHVRDIWAAYSKRQRRQTKYEIMLHSMAMGGMMGAPASSSPAANTADNPSRLIAMGLPVTFTKT